MCHDKMFGLTSTQKPEAVTNWSLKRRRCRFAKQLYGAPSLRTNGTGAKKGKTWNTKEWKAGGKFILSSGFEDSIKEKRMLEREAVRAEILSDCLVVIEMAFAAVYLVVRAGFHWQKGFSRVGWKFPRNVGTQTKNVARKEWQDERWNIKMERNNQNDNRIIKSIQKTK